MIVEDGYIIVHPVRTGGLPITMEDNLRLGVFGLVLWYRSAFHVSLRGV